MCFATAAPALAHDTGSGSDPIKTTTAPTLAQQQAWVDAYVTKSQAELTTLAAKIAADPKLTAAQKADWATKIAAKQSALTALRTAADAATTTDAVQAAVKNAMQADGVHGFGGWCGFWGAHHWRNSATAAARRNNHQKQRVRTAAKKSPQHTSDPGATAHPAGHTITLQAQRQSAPAVGVRTPRASTGAASRVLIQATTRADTAPVARRPARPAVPATLGNVHHNGGSHHR